MNTKEAVKIANQPKVSNLEARALRLTSLGALLMAILGLGFAVITKSEAILLDGSFSLIGFIISLLTHKVSRLVMRPGDQHYPFGYTTYEPMLNLSKGLLTGLISLYAIISAISALFTGGRPISAGIAIVYAGLAALGCFWLSWRVGSLAKRSKSSLAKVDAKNWVIDGVISAAIAITFLILELTKDTPIEALAPYADPIIVIVLVVLMIPIPVNITRDAWRQVMGYRPDPEKMVIINTAVDEIFKSAETVTWQVRSLEIGRLLYVQVYVLDPHQWSGNLAQQDQLRSQLYSRLSQQFFSIQMDLIFTQQQQWLNWGD